MDKLSQQQLSAYIILSFLVLIIGIIGLYLLYKGYVWFVNREEILII